VKKKIVNVPAASSQQARSATVGAVVDVDVGRGRSAPVPLGTLAGIRPCCLGGSDVDSDGVRSGIRQSDR
jgi:hypothetical protein